MAELTNYIEVPYGTTLTNSISAGLKTIHFVESNLGKLYCFFIDNNNDPALITSTNYGKTWSAATVLKNCTC